MSTIQNGITQYTPIVSSALISDEFHHGTYRIKYRWRSGSQDRRSLIVIFSGFRAPGTLDFVGAPVQGLRSDILWIEDDFEGTNTYYLGTRTQSKYQLAVVALIHDMAARLGVSHSDIALAGFSKGGSAALYYGMKFGFQTVLATVPQFRIGNYVTKQWPKVCEFMVEGESEYASVLDGILPDLARTADLSRTNLYLISSKADPWHEHEIEPNLEALRRAANFNYVLSDSDLVDSHMAVTRYNVPIIVSLMQSFGEGIYPRFGEVTNGHKSLVAPACAEDERGAFETKLTKYDLRGGRLYLEGDAIFRGVAAEGYGGLKRSVTFRAAGGQGFDCPLGTILDKSLTATWFHRARVDYTAGKFATLRRYGIDLRGLPRGRFDLELSMTLHGKSQLKKLTAPRKLLGFDMYRGDLFVLEGEPDEPVSLAKVDALKAGNAHEFFRNDVLEVKDGRLFVEGRYIVHGVAQDSYSATQYFVTLSNGETKTSFALGVLRRELNADEPHDPWLDQEFSTYSTPRRQGLDIQALTPGEYSIAVSVLKDGYVSSQVVPGTVVVSPRFVGMAESSSGSSLPRIAVIGSCVTRDNFNSTISPRWKSYASLGPVQYQMSVISLVSEPVAAADEDWEGLDDHARTVTQRDFSKTFFAELTESKPDVLVIDAFADSRFAILRVGNSWVTHNDWKLPHSAGYATWKNSARLSMADNQEEYLQLFTDSVVELKRRVLEVVPSVKFVVNKARNVDSYIDGGSVVRFNLDSIKQQNAHWDALDAILISELDAEPLDAMATGNHSTIDHPWGKGPVHYDISFYEKFESNLLSTLGYAPEVALKGV